MTDERLAERIVSVADNQDEAFAMYLFKRDRFMFGVIKNLFDRGTSLEAAEKRFIEVGCSEKQKLVYLGTLRHMKKVKENKS